MNNLFLIGYSEKFETYNQTYKILKVYSETLDNIDHEKNLVTLLILEQRISFIEII